MSRAVSKIEKIVNAPLKATMKNWVGTSMANEGVDIASKYAAALNKVLETGISTEKGARALSQLEELIGRKLERNVPVQLTEDDFLNAANRFTRATRFGPNPLNMPAWSNSAYGKSMLQFKNYFYNQTRFLLEHTVGEAMSGNVGRATRNLMILTTVLPPAGAVEIALQNLIRGQATNNDFTSIDGYINDLSAVGGIGIMKQVFDATTTPDRILNFAAGPTATTLADLGYTGLNSVKQMMSGEFGKPLESTYNLATQQFGGLGAGLRNILSPAQVGQMVP
jgi:hypothetical protein